MASNAYNRPEWMDNSYFKRVLSSAEKDDSISVISSRVESATKPGDNYATDLHRAVVKFKRRSETEEKSLVIKTGKPMGAMAEVMRRANVLTHESYIYGTFFPAIYNLMDEVPSLKDQLVSPKYFYSHSDDKSCSIVLDDLKAAGFRLATINYGLDLKHCLLVMRTIARFHAASLVLHEKQAEIMEPLMETFFSRGEDSGMGPFFSGIVATVAREVETWPDYKEEFAQKLHKIRDGTMERFRQGVIRREGEFCVLSHGDLWFNNMMFRYSEDNGEVEEVRFVDFQTSYWTSPAVDLQYFLHTSASAEVLEHSEVLIQEYYDTLCNVLKSLKCPQLQPTIDLIKEKIDERGYNAVLAAVVVRSLVTCDRSKPADIDNLIQEKAIIRLSEKYKTTLKKLLPLFKSKGWL